MSRSFIIILLCLLFVGRAHASSPNRIAWQTFHIPPIIMKTGEQRGQGFVDRMLLLIIEQMPEYEHSLPLTSHARALNDLKMGKHVCHPALFKTQEREQYAVFSKPVFFSPSNRLIILEQTAKRLSLSEPVDLSQLLHIDDVTIGLVKGRSYGANIDGMLAKFPEHYLIEMSLDKSEVLFNLTHHKRLTATVAYPFEIAFYAKQPKNGEGHKALLIAGTPDYAIGHIACPKNDWGQNIVKSVDQILYKIVATDEYLEAMTTWWSEERDKARFVRFYEDAFLSHYAQ